MSTAPDSPTLSRLLVVAAAVLWSLNGLFMKLLTQDNPTGLAQPPVPIFLIAFSRSFFAALVMLPLIPWRRIRWRPAMGLMAACFGGLNLMFIWALGRGTAANALILQYTAPAWILLAGVFWLRERPSRVELISLALAMIGLAVIVADAFLSPSWEERITVLVALGSGVGYAAVLLLLRILREAPGAWLTFQNFLVAALVALPLAVDQPWPRGDQMATLFLFGAVQLGFPYLLMARGVRGVSGHEAAMICLIEPLLSPCWAYLVSGELPANATFVGGGMILFALAYQYWPWRPPRRQMGTMNHNTESTSTPESP